MQSLNELLEYRIILASKSPRRLSLVEQMGFKVEVEKLDVEEDYPLETYYSAIPEFLADKKAKAFDIAKLGEKDILLTADTMVFLNKQIVDKPKDREEAMILLKNLSNQTHKVITGCTLKTKSKSISFSAKTEVSFKALTDEEITYYIDNYKPYDKAGSYGIQEWIGLIGVEKIKGCYYNVMGLPTQEIFRQINHIINSK
ncbi:MAG: Maf family nucleotide pyrophosphatase [Bacteroidales bacterium]|nr:Maf family nucleotide pyrophosphatase [Bacteroidales bacterium]MDD4704058.1 Maf family nucleotide pyrophosphatase [Bacteroidales bacterium]